MWTGLTRAGVEVATYPNTPGSLDIHAKVMVADDLTAFVGSQIFSKASLSYSRELGLTTSDRRGLDAGRRFRRREQYHLKHPTIARGTGRHHDHRRGPCQPPRNRAA